MSKKLFSISLELEIKSVTCPGVWLCNDGVISLIVETLGSKYETRTLPPYFPLVFHEVFYFKNKIYDADNLKGLQNALGKEKIRCQLIQWPNNCSSDKGIILARYIGSLANILYHDGALQNSSIDLLMDISTSFPGIISPKIEIETKTKIEEFNGCCADDNSYFPLRYNVQCKQNMVKKDYPKRQFTVCHSHNYHRNITGQRGEKTPINNYFKAQTYNKTSSENNLNEKSHGSMTNIYNEYLPENHNGSACQICIDYQNLFGNGENKYIKCECKNDQLTYQMPEELSISKNCDPELSGREIHKKLQKCFNSFCEDYRFRNKYYGSEKDLSFGKNQEQFYPSCLSERFESMRSECLCSHRCNC